MVFQAASVGASSVKGRLLRRPKGEKKLSLAALCTATCNGGIQLGVGEEGGHGWIGEGRS